MIDVRIYDKEFGHSPSVSANNTPKHIRWDRESPVHPTQTVFFTDRCLESEAPFANCKRKVAWLIEPPVICPSAYDTIRKLHCQFDYILTYDRSLIAHDPKKFLFYPFGGCWVPEGISPIKFSPEKVSMIASAKAGCEGYTLRHEIAKKLSDRIECFGQIVGKPIASKMDGLVKYGFSVAVENCRFDDWFTEKIIDCFACGTIPFYWGTANIGKYFDPEGIIAFDSVEDLEDKIDMFASASFYNSHYRHVLVNYELAKKYRCTEDWIFNHYPFLFE